MSDIDRTNSHPVVGSHGFSADFKPYNAVEDKNRWNVNDQVFPLTKSGMDLFFRGVIIGMSSSPTNANSCVLQYDEIYYGVVAAEAVYYQWVSAQTDSYMFFKKIVEIYDAAKQIDAGCHTKETAVDIRKNLTSYKFWT